jgi:hypothetical protein
MVTVVGNMREAVVYTIAAVYTLAVVVSVIKDVDLMTTHINTERAPSEIAINLTSSVRKTR